MASIVPESLRGTQSRLHADCMKAQQTAILRLMSVHLQIRDLPDDLHKTLRERADLRGVSLRQYALDILREHCRQPTLNEWLEGLHRLAPTTPRTPTAHPIDSAAAVRAARDEDDAKWIDALRRP